MKSRPSKNSIQFGGRQIRYRLHRADRKRLRIVVSPALTVDVFAPNTAEEDQIREAIKKKARWISKTLDKVETYQPLPTPKRYVGGETFVYLGRQYRLRVRNGPKQPAKLLGRFLWVWVKDKSDTKSIRRAVDAWFRKRARETLGRYMDKCYTIASRHGVPEPLLVIRVMRTRWGSCSAAGRITLNVKPVSYTHLTLPTN